MKYKIQFATLAFACLTFNHATAATVFSFQQGDLRQDGTLYGTGSAYSGTLDGSITDQAPNNSMVANTQDRVGNQFRATTGNVGTNGQQWSALFSYDLTELGDYLTVNPTLNISEASFSLTRTGGAGNSAIGLYQTEAFTSSATWVTYDGTNAWASPLRANSGGLAGGGTLVDSSLLNGSSLGSADSPMVFSTSTSFVSAVENALSRGDKTLYLVALANTYTSLDTYGIFANNAAATVDSRPELTITIVPEPSSALLGGLGLLVLLRRRRA